MHETYYSQAREWTKHFKIKKNAKVLDVGCANGILANYLHVNFNASVTGLDINANCILDPEGCLNNKIYGDFQSLCLSSFRDQRFDHVIFSDSLEHMIDTGKALELAYSLLKTNGTILISLPNIQHYSAVFPLIFGFWDYKEWGILDRTHLKFFTKKSLHKLLSCLEYSKYSIISPIPSKTKSFVLDKLTMGFFHGFLSSHIYCEITK